MPELETYHGVYLWKYVPNLPAAITFTILFAILTVAHTWKTLTKRLWFCLPFVIGGYCEVIGYMMRAVAWNSTGSLALYIMQATFLLLPPVFFAATQYMVYSRVVRAVQGNRFSLISPKWTTRIFVLGDIFCLNIQSSGAGLLAKPKNLRIGDYIIIAGLILQVLIFMLFILCCMIFNMRFAANVRGKGVALDLPWQSCLYMLYSTSLLVLVRNIFRVVEYVMGSDSYLFKNEWPAYVFDGVLMLVVMLDFYIRYPGRFQASSSESMIELRTAAESSGEHEDDERIRQVAS